MLRFTNVSIHVEERSAEDKELTRVQDFMRLLYLKYPHTVALVVRTSDLASELMSEVAQEAWAAVSGQDTAPAVLSFSASLPALRWALPPGPKLK